MQKREEDNGHTVHKDCQKTDWQYQKTYTEKQNFHTYLKSIVANK